VPSSAAGHGGTDTITLVVTMAIKPEFEQDFLAVARAFARRVHAEEPGTLLYVLTKHPERDHTYVWVERYRDEVAFKTHAESLYMAEVLPKLAQYLDGRPELLRLSQVVPN
jgi:quinol monooxygenase YgiN